MKHLILGILVFFLSIGAVAAKEDVHIFHYPVTNFYIKDGDTIAADIDLGLGIYRRSVIRMLGYDAPETWRPKTTSELEKGLKATAFLKELLKSGKGTIKVQGRYSDSFGRILGDLYTEDGRSVSELMITNKHIK